jgi:molecular chaperone DnaK (HSP70)
MKSGKSQHRCHVFLRSNRHGDDANRDLRHQYQSVLNYAKSHNMEIVESLYVQGSAQSQATMSAIEQVFERKSKLNDFDKLLAVSWDRCPAPLNWYHRRL